MSFLDISFPAEVAIGAIGGPKFSTNINISKGNSESRTSNWSNARMAYNITSSIKNQNQYNQLVALFLKCKGMANGFRFKDWNDFTCEKLILGVADGFKNAWQLGKTYQIGAESVVRIITKPTRSSVQIYQNEDQNPISSNLYNVDYLTGLVTFLTAPINTTVLKFSCEFDVPVRFDTDFLPISAVSADVYDVKNLSLLEINA